VSGPLTGFAQPPELTLPARHTPPELRPEAWAFFPMKRLTPATMGVATKRLRKRKTVAPAAIHFFMDPT
jgi:hypothetical protein